MSKYTHEQITQDDVVKKYGEQDERLKTPLAQDLIRTNEVGIIDFDVLFTIGKGTFEIHELNVFGKKIPIRALSIREELQIKHETHVALQKDPMYIHMRDDSSEFEKLRLIKTLSLASSSSIHTPNDRFLKEAEIMECSSATVAGLITAYQDIERQYNPPIENYSEDAINEIVSKLLDPKHRAAIIAGLDLWLMRIILTILLGMNDAQEVNTSIVTSLEDSLPKNKIETKQEIL